MPRKIRDYADFYPHLKALDFKKNIEKAKNRQIPKSQRAQAYFDAAKILHQYGMELTGTELDPDGFVNNGLYPYFGSIQNRFAILSFQAKIKYASRDQVSSLSMLRKKIYYNRGFFYGSQEEEKKALASLPTPNKRYHYRYKAAELMWKSANLLPNNHELKALALNQGGVFLMNLDPALANKYYKALVKTCSKTSLGRFAEKKKWFQLESTKAIN